MSAENRGRPEDVTIGDLEQAGLPAPSVIRPAKIATIDAADATRLGKIPVEIARRVASVLARQISSSQT